MYRYFFKRIIDFFTSLISLIILSPVFIIVTICLFFTNKGTPFFFQLRPGLNEKIFQIIKFKTMNNKKDENGKLLPDAQRLTKVGAFIRKTSLDELPQLLNVLKGDMSLIGPRPLLSEYLPLYSEEERKRHLIKPGITGWAQVNGRNAITWSKKFELDVYYVKNISLLLDIKIILKTFQKVLSSKDISIEPISKLIDEKRMENESN